MSNSLFDNIIFGPIRSRRLGNSLGINLLPVASKFCNFDCIYCECGWTDNHKNSAKNLPDPHAITEHLVDKIQALLDDKVTIHSITFAGNGEPTLHPKFEEIMADVVLIRNLMIPDAKISILSNGTMLHKKSIIKAMQEVDHCILKLDAGTEALFQKINQPMGGITIQKIKRNLLKLRGVLTVQTLFFRGEHKGERIDNTTPEEIEAWINHLADLHPKQVMIYSLDRPSPAHNLVQVSKKELNAIADKLRPHQIKTLVT